MTQIIQLNGIDKKIYQLIGPLAMNPEVLHFNNNYPFKTGEQYEWYIAIIKKKVVGFIPLEHRKKEWMINNYYVHPDYLNDVLPLLIATIVETYKKENTIILSAIVQSKHLPFFIQKGFVITKAWKIYYKMKLEV